MVTMTARLATLLSDGVRLDFTDPERPDFQVLPHHRAAVAALLAPDVKPAIQELLRQAATYRRTLLDLFRLNTAGTDGDRGRQLVAEEMRLRDDLGPTLADAVRAQVAGDYRATTGLCPLCGGPIHD